MKKFILFVLAGILIVCMGATLTTRTAGYEKLVVSAAGGETRLATGATTVYNIGVPSPGTTALAPKDLMGRDYSSATNAVELICYATASANDTTEMEIYGVSVDGPPVRICDVVWIYGTARHTSDTVLWADTCTITNDWHTAGVTASDSGNNVIAKLTFDVTGYRYLYAVAYGRSVGTATGITVLMRPF